MKWELVDENADKKPKITVNEEYLKRKEPTSTMKYFKYEHLPAHLKPISKLFGDLAQTLESNVPGGPEKSAGMRKLLEAKDCFVRASLE